MLSAFGLALPSGSQILLMLVVGFILHVGMRRLRAERARRLGHTPQPTLLSKGQAALPSAIELLAGAGQSATPVLSADAIVMRTTPGVRLVALVLGGAMLWLLFGPSHGVFVAEGWPTWAMAAVAAVSLVGTVTFEARVDRDRLVVVHFIHWRREYRWRDLVAIRDDGGYMWRLDFTSGRAWLPKHLVGMPGFLSLVATHLDRNAAHARTARG